MIEITETKQMTLSDYSDIKTEIRNNLTAIKNDFNDIALRFVAIGYYLKQIREKKMYLEDGYKNIYEFAQKEYHMTESETTRSMQVNSRYSENGNSMVIQDKYRGFGKSILIEMINMPEEDFELIKENTKISDIQELKRAEREAETEPEEIEGQMSLIKNMPGVVPNADKPKKEEVTIKDAIREMFRPRERKEQLDTLVGMDPESDAMNWWVDDFNASGNLTYKKMPFFFFFYSKQDGLKIKNIPEGTIERKTYKDFYFMVRAAFGQETARGTNVWQQAFGEEYEAEKKREREKNEAEENRRKEEERILKEKEKLKKEREKIKKEKEKLKKAKNVINIQCEEVSKEEKEEPETTENRSQEPEILTGEVENEEKEPETTVCDIAQTTDCFNAEGVLQSERIILTREQYENILIGKKKFFVSIQDFKEGDIIKFGMERVNQELLCPAQGKVIYKEPLMLTKQNIYGFE